MILTSDWHLRYYTWERRDGIVGDALCAARQIVSYAVETSQSIVVAGDVLHYPVLDAELAHKIREVVLPLEKAGLKLYHVLGQHDVSYQSKRSFLSVISPACEHIHHRLIQEDGVSFVGVDWDVKSRYFKNLEQCPPADWLVTHQRHKAYLGSQGWFSEDDLPAWCRFLVIGDYHDASEFVEVTTAQGVKVNRLCPGSIAPTSLGEKKEKFFYELKPNGELHLRELVSRKIMDFDLTDKVDTWEMRLDSLEEAVIEAIQESEMIAEEYPELAKPVIVLIHSGEREQVDDLRRLTVRYADSAHFVWRTKPATRQVEEERDSILGEDSVSFVEAAGKLGFELDEQEAAILKQLEHRSAREVVKEVLRSL